MFIWSIDGIFFTFIDYYIFSFDYYIWHVYVDLFDFQSYFYFYDVDIAYINK